MLSMGKPNGRGDTLSKGVCVFCVIWLAALTHILRHTGPVWQVAWANPKFGHILASCSYDGKVIIWKEQQQAPTPNSLSGGWTKIKEHTLHTASGENHDDAARGA
jgi:WD40 repeat protein